MISHIHFKYTYMQINLDLHLNDIVYFSMMSSRRQHVTRIKIYELLIFINDLYIIYGL